MDIRKEIVTLLQSKNLKVSSAESCTGGLISQMITSVPGASSVFELGVCSYSNDIKMKVLEVRKETIAEFTEVSYRCAEEMASGVLKLSGADIAISTTGYAGPSGGTEENPVGTVYIGLARGDEVTSEKKNFNEDLCNNRALICQRCAEYCLSKLCSMVKNM